MLDFSDKKVLITGASGAIGREIARQLYSFNAIIYISGTKINVLKELQSELGSRCYIVPCNLSSSEDIKNLIKEVEVGGIDILVNNAGITRDNLMIRMKDEDWEEVINVNLNASFKLSRSCIRGMMKKRWGRIINITSIVGIVGNPGQTNYCSAKAGLIGMSKSLALEVAARGITVNCVAPGFIKTPMTDILSDEQKNHLLSKIPVGKIGLPKDIAFAVSFLASYEAGYITGQTFHINGGLAMI